MFSFDDGPYTQDMLTQLFDILHKHHAAAIFFDIGRLVKTRSAEAKYTVEQGGIMGNHTFDHPFLSKLTHAKIDQEIDKTQSEI